MSKIKLGVILGGRSTEHEVSMASGKNVLDNLDTEKYEIYPIYINKNGQWFEYVENNEIENIIEYVKKLDVVFPVLHGLGGEDGTIQGMLEMFEIPYVGCGIMASSVGMDKIYTKIILDKAKIKQALSCYVKVINGKYILVDDNFEEKEMLIEDITKLLQDKLGNIVFVKPSRSGSSVGVNKARDDKELEYAIKEAAKYDNRILIEKAIVGKEVECAVLGNEDVIAGCVGEIKAADEFYSFDAKYNNQESKTIIPANISEKEQEIIRTLAIKAFKAISGKGLARVDFFVEEKTGEIYLNEINTMPGFTAISMYPKLMEAYGIEYKELLDKLILLALKK